MKMKKALAVAFTLLAFAGCSKKNDGDKPSDTPATSVAINGVDYPTVTIGSQEWTAVNYRGPGGVAVNDTLDTNIYGRYYSNSDVANITLPEGWRVPTKDDYIKLLNNYPGSKPGDFGTYLGYNQASVALRSKNDWLTNTGENISGFNAYPAGYYDSEFKITLSVKIIAAFMTTTKAGISVGYGNYNLFIGNAGDNPAPDLIACTIDGITPQMHTSVRFVRDK